MCIHPRLRQARVWRSACRKFTPDPLSVRPVEGEESVLVLVTPHLLRSIALFSTATRAAFHGEAHPTSSGDNRCHCCSESYAANGLKRANIVSRWRGRDIGGHQNAPPSWQKFVVAVFLISVAISLLRHTEFFDSWT